jgi:hypothetical protein
MKKLTQKRKLKMIKYEIWNDSKNDDKRFDNIENDEKSITSKHNNQMKQ